MKKETVLFERYQIKQCIGSGSTSKVYLVWDLKLEKKWALKRIEKDNQLSFGEVDVMKELDSPYIPRIVDVYEKEDFLYIVMDYIEGINLEQLLLRNKKIDEKLVVTWGICICKTLAYLHARKPAIIFCDLKPGNLILTKDGNLKLIDFGIAAANHGKKGLGTRGYAAPEQYDGTTQIDEKSDIYSLGKTMERLAGDKPSKSLKRIIKKCCEEDRKKRYRNIRMLKRDLMFLQENPFRQWKQMMRNHRWILRIAFVIGVAIFTFSYQQAKEEKRWKSYMTTYIEDGYTKQDLDEMVQYIEEKDYRVSDVFLRYVGCIYLQGDTRHYSFGPDYKLSYQYLKRQKHPGELGKQYILLSEELSKNTNQIKWEKVSKAMKEIRQQMLDFQMADMLLSLYSKEKDFLEPYVDVKSEMKTLLTWMEKNQSENPKQQRYEKEQILKRKVELYQGDSNWQEYVKEYEQILNRVEDKIALRLEVAIYYERKAQYDLARKEYEKMIKQYPKQEDGYIFYGLFLYQQGDVKGAQRMCKKVEDMKISYNYNFEQLKEKLGG